MREVSTALIVTNEGKIGFRDDIMSSGDTGTVEIGQCLSQFL